MIKCKQFNKIQMKLILKLYFIIIMSSENYSKNIITSALKSLFAHLYAGNTILLSATAEPIKKKLLINYLTFKTDAIV